MSEWAVSVDDERAVADLVESFDLGPIVDAEGRRFLIERQVARVGGLKIEVFSDEHPPPHFRVSYAGETARFTIAECSPLDDGLATYRRNVRKWHASNKELLIARWNEARPSDCPVGEFRG